MTTATASNTCAPGGAAVTSYASTAAAAWLYLEVNGAAVGDHVSVDWFDPNGKDEFTNSFQPLSVAGEVCFSASLNIAGTTVATLPGGWSARVTYNSSTLISLPFTITGSSGGSCVYAVNPLTVSAPTAPATAAGGIGSITVSTIAGCAWTAASNSSFLTINAGSSSGTGNGTVSYTVAANTTSSARTGTMTIAGQTVTVNQAAGTACAYALNPTSGGVPNAGGSGSFTVSTTSGCAWTATPNASWISITSGPGGTGNGTVSYTAAANTTSSSRTGTITVGSTGSTQTFTLNQGTSQIASGQPFFVDGRSNLWAAGRTTAPTGLVPPVFPFPAGSGQMITFSNITGTASCSGQPGVCPPASGPNGALGPTGGNPAGTLAPDQNISGLIERTSGYFLAGVFLDNNVPSGTPPESLDFTNEDFTKINPKIAQVFFIGDGMTNGSPKQFFVPPTATRLFLGLTDGEGIECCFNDDTGGFNVTLNLAPGGPPCSYSLTPNPFPVSAAGGSAP